MSLVTRKPVLGCTATEDGYRFEISVLGSIRIVLSKVCTKYVAKTKELISC